MKNNIIVLFFKSAVQNVLFRSLFGQKRYPWAAQRWILYIATFIVHNKKTERLRDWKTQMTHCQMKLTLMSFEIWVVCLESEYLHSSFTHTWKSHSAELQPSTTPEWRQHHSRCRVFWKRNMVVYTQCTFTQSVPLKRRKKMFYRVLRKSHNIPLCGSVKEFLIWYHLPNSPDISSEMDLSLQ